MFNAHKQTTTVSDIKSLLSSQREKLGYEEVKSLQTNSTTGKVCGFLGFPNPPLTHTKFSDVSGKCQNLIYLL